MIPKIQVEPDNPRFRPLLNERLEQIATALEALQGGSAASVSGGRVYVGTHEQRLALGARDVDEGTIFQESDRTVTYMALTSGSARKWRYIGGVHRCALASLPADLATDELQDSTGLLAITTTYAHVHRWTGSAWEWGPGETGSAFVQGFAIAPGTGWKLCDGSGSPVTYEKADGTTATVAVPDMRGFFPVYAAAYAGTTNAETTGTVTGTAASTTDLAGSNIAAGATSTDVPAHHHDVTGTSTGALPPNIELLPYFRQ